MNDVSLEFILRRLLVMQYVLETKIPGYTESFDGIADEMKGLTKEVAGLLRDGDAKGAEKRLIGFRP